MRPPDLHRLRAGLSAVVGRQLGFIEFAAEATELLAAAVPFDRSCWHTVDPGTVLFTGSVNQGISCSGRWLADHEYVIDDVNQWSTLARTGQLAGRSSAATSGDLNRSARHRSTASWGIGDELRVSFVVDGVYWGAAGFLRDDDRPWFTEDEEQEMRAVIDLLASGCRRALVGTGHLVRDAPNVKGPAVMILADNGEAEVVTPAAALWVNDLLEEPRPRTPAQSKVVQAVAAQSRARGDGSDPIAAPSRARVRTRSGEWLVVYATTLSGETGARTAIVIQPAVPAEVAPLLAVAYGLTNREKDVSRLCLQGRSSKEIALALGITVYTVQDHLKSIFEKTATRTRNELVGRVFLSHYTTRWEEHADVPPGWTANIAAEAATPRTPSADDANSGGRR
ncbi:MAG TPA: helix-turn-helix transcriptional regulator [Candidatus Limnocylindrales bacterium]|nr:helix-turn-helix transcriptional regulator [Candidatus Limnocylindrales bacterium]